MANFYARMMDAQTGGEGRYTFEASDDMMRRPADEVVDLFFEHISVRVLKHKVEWELNSVMKHRDRNIITAMGSLLHDQDPPMPFLLMIADQE